MSDEQKVAEIRAAMPASQVAVYLNTGTAGPVSRRCYEAMQAIAAHEFERGRVGADHLTWATQHQERARAAVARLVGADPLEIALTHFTTEGMNIAVNSLNWRPGDEVITTGIEHSGGLMPLYNIRQRHGVTVRFADVGHGEGAAAAVEALITPRTRMIVMSHVSYSTGALLPLGEMAALARRHGLPLAVDGAQGAGAMTLDLPASGVDFYAIPGQKWLCGPEDTAALYIRRGHLSEALPTYVGYRSMTSYDQGGYFVPRPGGARFEIGKRSTPGLAGQAASIGWLLDEVGADWAYARIARLAREARRALLAVPGVEVLTPAAMVGLVSFRIPGHESEAIVSAFHERGLIIRSIVHPACVRLATGYYNTEAEVEQAVEVARALART